MAITLDGTTGITTPGLTNTGTETIVNLTTTGNTILGDASTDTLNVGNGDLIKDSSGNVGIGVTPSAWNSAWKGIQLSPTAALTNRTNQNLYLSNNWYIDSGSTDRYIQNGYSTFYTQNSGGQHAWYNAASGTAGNAITFTQAMTLNASGNLGVGTTPSGRLDWDRLGEAYALSSSSYSLYTVAGTLSNVTALSNGVNSGALISFNAYNSTAGATGIFLGAVAGSAGNGPANFVVGRRTGTSAWAESLRIDTSGNLGLGVTPSTWTSQTALQVGGGATGASLSSGTNGVILASNLIYNSGWKYLANGYILYYQQSGGAHYWGNAPSGTAGNVATVTDRMVLDASGNLIVGKTVATTGESIQGLLGLADGRIGATSDSPSWFSRTTSNGDVIRFNRGSITAVGSISVTTTATSYVTSSDYRLKENVVPMTGALDTVSALKPVTYNWKADGSDGQGFIAHELAEVVPDCVTGEKDATEEQEYEISPAIPAVLDEEGNEVTPAVEAVMGTRTVPVYQGIDTSFLVATLTAAIQEQQAMIDELKAKVAAIVQPVGLMARNGVSINISINIFWTQNVNNTQ